MIYDCLTPLPEDNIVNYPLGRPCASLKAISLSYLISVRWINVYCPCKLPTLVEGPAEYALLSTRI